MKHQFDLQICFNTITDLLKCMESVKKEIDSGIISCGLMYDSDCIYNYDIKDFYPEGKADEMQEL